MTNWQHRNHPQPGTQEHYEFVHKPLMAQQERQATAFELERQERETGHARSYIPTSPAPRPSEIGETDCGYAAHNHPQHNCPLPAVGRCRMCDRQYCQTHATLNSAKLPVLDVCCLHAWVAEHFPPTTAANKDQIDDSPTTPPTVNNKQHETKIDPTTPQHLKSWPQRLIEKLESLAHSIRHTTNN